MNTTDNIGTNRNYKDRLFRLLFADKKNGLELYNALNHTAYDNMEDLEIHTLEDVIWMKMKNDVAYLVRDILTLYEHQSTVNPNLPVRGLLYFSDMFRGILQGKHLYGTKLIMLPTPVYIVFYNGDREIGEVQWLKLSDAFIHGNEQSKMELQVQVLNINYGHNKQLMERCPTLKEYAILVGAIKTYCREMSFEESVKRAIDECIANGVLRDFLMIRRAEVMNSLLTEYDEERVLADIGQERYEDGKSDGIAEGIAIGKTEGIAEGILELLNIQGMVPEKLEITIRTETDLKTLKGWLKLAAMTDSVETFQNQMDKIPDTK